MAATWHGWRSWDWTASRWSSQGNEERTTANLLLEELRSAGHDAAAAEVQRLAGRRPSGHSGNEDKEKRDAEQPPGKRRRKNAQERRQQRQRAEARFAGKLLQKVEILAHRGAAATAPLSRACWSNAAPQAQSVPPWTGSAAPRKSTVEKNADRGGEEVPEPQRHQEDGRDSVRGAPI